MILIKFIYFVMNTSKKLIKFNIVQYKKQALKMIFESQKESTTKQRYLIKSRSFLSSNHLIYFFYLYSFKTKEIVNIVFIKLVFFIFYKQYFFKPKLEKKNLFRPKFFITRFVFQPYYFVDFLLLLSNIAFLIIT